MTSWWKTLFSDTDRYLSGYADRFAAFTKREVGFLLDILPKGSVLDIPSGHGRHAVPLANAGYEVHCVDYQQAFLDLIPEHPLITKEQADMRTYYTGDEYDNVICMFSSFGYFGEEEDRQTLQNFVRACKKGGKIIIDVNNPHTTTDTIESPIGESVRIFNYMPEWYEETCKIEKIYGNYLGELFTPLSKRMILVLKK